MANKGLAGVDFGCVAMIGLTGVFPGCVANKGLTGWRLVTGDSWKVGAKEVDSRKLKVERKAPEETLRPVRKLRLVRWWEARVLNVGRVKERSFDSLRSLRMTILVG